MRIKSISIPADGDHGRVELCLESDGEEEVNSVFAGRVTFKLNINSSGYLHAAVYVMPELLDTQKRDSLEQNSSQGLFDS